MIKIRYLDLPTGLHVRAEAQGTDTIVYLLPGLTMVQRRAALHRARSSARMGHGPSLPAARFAAAIAADRVRTTIRNAAAAMRVHPGLVIPPVIIILSAVLAYMLLASMSITYRGPGAGGGLEPDPVLQGVAPPGSTHAAGLEPDRTAPGSARGGQAGGSGASPHSLSSSSSSSSSPRLPSPRLPSPRLPSPRSPSSSPLPPRSPSPSASQPDPDPSPSRVLPDPSPTAGPAPSPSPSPSSSGNGGCVPVGPLGVCVHL